MLRGAAKRTHDDNAVKHCQCWTTEGTCSFKELSASFNGSADHGGRFRGATKLKGIKDFAAKDYGLEPIQLDTWGQFVFIRADPFRCVCSLEAGLAWAP